MKRTTLAGVLALLIGIPLTAWTSLALEREAERELARESAAGRQATTEAARAMAVAAQEFLERLSAEQRAEAAFPFEDAERTRWHFLPGEMHPRRGAAIRDMNEEQRAAAHGLLSSGLSPGGYATATAVMELEGVLRDLEGPDGRFERDPELYYFSIFGTPEDSGAWGWRVEGHHLSLHFTVVEGGWVATAPAFLGSNPAEVREGSRRGLRVLAEREDVARRLFASLDEEQRSVAWISRDAPNDILTSAELEIDPLEPGGVRAADLRPDQRDLLLTLIEVYAGLAREDLAAARMEVLRQSNVDDITFAWAGGAEPGERHYYRVQGTSFLIEYDNTQNDANHVHSVWRDFDGDFGRDILREHLAEAEH